MLKRALKLAGIFLLSVFVLTNLVLGYFGISSIFLTIIVYGLLGMTGHYLFKLLIKNTERRKNYVLAFTTLLISLFIGELALRYVFRVGLERHEIDGNFFYSIPYKMGLQNLMRKFGNNSVWMPNYKPYSQDVKSNSEFTYTHSYNSIGLRDREPPKDHSKFCIVGLGDSFTEGSGTPQDSTWLRLLETELNRSGVNNPHGVVCINGGICGSEPFEEYILLKELLLTYKPQLVIVATNWTDINDIVKNGGWDRYSDFRKAPWWAYIYQFSFIARAIIHTVHPVNWLFLTPEEARKEEENARTKLERCLTDDYQKLAIENNFKLVIVLHPMLFELESNLFQFQDLYEKLKQNPDIVTINLFDAFKHAKEQTGITYESLFWKNDGHNNSKGYKLWADTLSVEIKLLIKELAEQKAKQP